MNIPPRAVRGKHFPAVHPEVLSRRAAHVGVSSALYAATGRRIRYRVHLTWTDPSTPSGRSDECIEFSRPDRLLDLLRRINETPARPLLSARLEARPAPRWEAVTPAFLLWRAAERERKRGGAR